MIVSGRYGAFGLVGCQEFETLQDRLSLLLDAAAQRGFDDSTYAFKAAREFFEKNDSFVSGPVIVFSDSACKTLVDEANGRINALNAAMGPVAPIPIGPAVEAKAAPDIAGTLKWIAAGAVAIGAAYTLAPILKVILRGKKS